MRKPVQPTPLIYGLTNWYEQRGGSLRRGARVKAQFASEKLVAAEMANFSVVRGVEAGETKGTPVRVIVIVKADARVAGGKSRIRCGKFQNRSEEHTSELQ